MASIIPLTPAKKKPRYRAVVVGYQSGDWHNYVRAGWLTHHVHQWNGEPPNESGLHIVVATMIRRTA